MFNISTSRKSFAVISVTLEMVVICHHLLFYRQSSGSEWLSNNVQAISNFHICNLDNWQFWQKIWQFSDKSCCGLIVFKYFGRWRVTFKASEITSNLIVCLEMANCCKLGKSQIRGRFFFFLCKNTNFCQIILDYFHE